MLLTLDTGRERACCEMPIKYALIDSMSWNLAWPVVGRSIVSEEATWGLLP